MPRCPIATIATVRELVAAALVLGGTGVAALMPAPAPAVPPAATTTADEDADALAPHAAFARVAPLAGHWRTTGSDGLVEEAWTAPVGGNMTGLYRALGADGSTRTLELLALAPTEDGGLELRFRHFHADLQPWALERDGPLVLRAAPASATDPDARRVRFTAVDPGASVRAITYDVRERGRLHVSVALAGEPDPTFEVRFERAAVPGRPGPGGASGDDRD